MVKLSNNSTPPGGEFGKLIKVQKSGSWDRVAYAKRGQKVSLEKYKNNLSVGMFV